MTPDQLRLKHPRFIYTSYTVATDADAVTISYEFLLEPDSTFRPRVVIPYTGAIPEGALDSYAFHLGLAEAISYWKSACPKELVIEAGVLTTEQIRFWKDLFLHGLGEFFYQNQIDFTKEDFLTMTSRSDGENVQARSKPDANDKTRIFSQEFPPSRLRHTAYEANDACDLVLAGGGKDSATTLGMLEQSGRKTSVMAVNPTQAARDNIRAAGIKDPILVTRTIDPALLALNGAGYLNGHTPFSAYLAFLGVLAARLYGCENVIVSNERSANEGNVMYKGMEVNHQYSKSFRFEQMFRQYCADYLEDAPTYFSLLRPLNDMQIGMLFARYPKFFATFRSCNVGSRTNAWCGTCAKCAFTYLALFPFFSFEDMMRIFGRDYFAVPEILEHIRGLTGITPLKPFECVGTRQESVLAVYLAVEKFLSEHREVPEGLLKIKSDIGRSRDEIFRQEEEMLYRWGDTYNLPPEHMTFLRSAWQGLGNGMEQV